MSHNHFHQDGPVAGDRPLQRAYGVAIALNFAFVILEFILGRTSHSMGLVSDAGHKLLDVLMLVLALIGFRLARRPASDARRISAFIALANTAVLLVAVVIIFVESVGKFAVPAPVDGTVVSWTAAAGILVSGLSAWLLMRHRGDINTRAAFLHMAADSLLSLGVVVAGIVISRTGLHVIDPGISIVIAAVILVNTIKLLADAIRSLTAK